MLGGKEALLILSGVEGGAHLRQNADVAANLVLHMAYRKIADIAAALEENGMLTPARP